MTIDEAKAYFKRHIDLYCVTGICREAEEMAIQALEQEPSGDLISRQAVLDKFQWHSGDESNKYLTLWTFVENMPSINPQEPKWIPVSERLPEEGGKYLVYTWSHEIETAQYVDGYWNIKTPISAWMPLPEPYREVEK